jgi:TRAP-type mannitol/chloroaromatic compound transport system permease small subunit
MIREILIRLKRAVQSLAWLLDRVTYICLVASGAMIFLMALVTSYGVARRYVFASPDANAYLVTCLFMLGCVVFGIAHIQRLRRHITVDYLSRHLPRVARDIVLNVAGPIFGLVFCAVIIWKSWLDGWFAFQSGQVVQHVSQIPTYPLKLAVPVGAGLLCLVLIAQILRYLASLGGKVSQAN